MVAAAIGGSALLNLGGSLLSSNAATSAAQTQADAANNAAALQQQNQQQIRSDLLPYNTAGQNALTTLQGQLPSLTAPITMDQSTLEATPGYQFNLSQGLKSVQSANAAKGLGISGAALKGAADYATGLADSTYQNQFNNAQTNRQTTYNMLTGLTGQGENAAAQTGTLGTANTVAANNALIGGANATAGGIVGSANNLSSGINGIGNAGTNYLLYSKLLGISNNGTPTPLSSGQINLTNSYVPSLAGPI